MVRRRAHALENAWFVAHFVKPGARLVVEAREELLRRKVVDVVLAVEIDLLEHVPVAERDGRRQVADDREQVGDDVVERPALESAVPVEHREAVHDDYVRHIPASCKIDLVVHEVVTRGYRELEYPIGLLAVGKPVKSHRLTKILKRRRIRPASVDDADLAKRLRPSFIGDFHIVHVEALRNFHLERLSRPDGRRLLHPPPRFAEFALARDVAVVHDVENLPRIVRRRDLRRCAIIDTSGICIDARRNPPESAARHAVIAALEGEERPRRCIYGERGRRRKSAWITAPRRNTQAIYSALEHRLRLSAGTLEPRICGGGPEKELCRMMVVDVGNGLVAKRQRLISGKRHLAALHAADENLCRAVRRPLHRDMRPCTVRQVDSVEFARKRLARPVAHRKAHLPRRRKIRKAQDASKPVAEALVVVASADVAVVCLEKRRLIAQALCV